MNVLFDKCTKALDYATKSKTYGAFYSEKTDADTNVHVHECCEVFFNISGGKSYLIGDRVYEVEDGDLFIINQFEAHKITSDPERKFIRYIMQVHPEFLYANSTNKTDLSHCFYTRGKDLSNKVSLSREEQEKLIAHINKLENRYDYGEDILKNLIAVEILVLVNAAFSHYAMAEKASGSGAIKNAIDYINTNFSQHLSLDTIAQNSYISVNQLCRLFNKYCGTTVAKYITSRRISEAKKLLLSGRSVTDTAIMCGFEDYANFIRVFKKHVGVTPGKYNGN